MARIATTATGRGNCGSATVAAMADSGYRGKVGQRRKEYNETGSNRSSTGSESSRSSTGSSRGGNRSSTGSENDNFKCYYCTEKSHYGGWKSCPKKMKEDPDWTPQKNGRDFSGKDFQKTPNRY